MANQKPLLEETKNKEPKLTLNKNDVLINATSPLDAQAPIHSNSQIIPLSAGKEFKDNIEEGIRLQFDDIKLEIKNKKKGEENIQILRGISGCAYPGELYGIIGASGGGKTTLLSILTGRIRTISSLASNSISSGIITMNNVTVDAERKEEFNYLSKNIAFVMQNDLLFATETCGEAIEVSASLRLIDNKQKLTKDDKLKYATEIMSDLDLIKCKNTYIGSEEVRGLSGGERTRTSIGIELVTNPDIIILDEPTSGLDAASAYSTMLLLKDLANKGKTVMACIHQPSSEIFSAIDRILILAKGKVVYEGKVKPDLYNYLKSINYQCPQFTNIADYVIQQINKNTDYFIQKWYEFKKNKDIIRDLPKLKKTVSTASEIGEIHPKEMVSITTQCQVLMARQFKIFLRDRNLTHIRLIQILFVAILMGLIWWRLDDITHDMSPNQISTNLQDRFGALFLATSYLAMNAIATSNQTFPTQRLIFEKERSGNWYYSTPWILSKFCIDIPWTIIVIIPLALLTKYMINLHCNLFWYYFTLSLIALSSDSLGFFIGSLAPNSRTAAQLLPVIVTPLMLFSGFFININTIPIWLRWIRWIDPYYYGVEILCILEFKDVYMGDTILAQYDMDVDNKWRDIIFLFGLFGLFRILSIAWLLLKNGW